MKKNVFFMLSFILILAACAAVTPVLCAQGEDTHTSFDISDEYYFAESVDERGDCPDSQTVEASRGDEAQLFEEGFAGGKGTSSSPYQIATAAQLKYMAKCVNDSSLARSYFVLTEDIDLGGEEWTPIGIYTKSGAYEACFGGTFDGNGHTVSNFKITDSSLKYIGFFGFIYNGTVKNLTVNSFLIDVSADAYLYGGPIVGRMISNISTQYYIDNCRAENGSVRLSSETYSSYAGGLAGYAMPTQYSNIIIRNSSSDCAVYSDSAHSASSESMSAYAGGLVGYTAASTSGYLTFENCRASGTVTASHSFASGKTASYAGGLFGYFGSSAQAKKAQVNNCFASGAVHAESFLPPLSGGFAGIISTSASTTANIVEISDCYASGNVSSDCLDTGSETEYTACIGGFAGRIADSTGVSVLRNVYSAGDVTNKADIKDYSSAFIGYRTVGTLENCYTLETASVNGISGVSEEGVSMIASGAKSDADSYTGFDFDSVWAVDADSEYSLPTLKNCEHVSGTYTATFMSGTELFKVICAEKGTALNAPSEIPTKKSDNTYKYSFSYWSTSPDGEEKYEFSVIDSDVTLYAIYDKSYIEYVISFFNGDDLFEDPQYLTYGSSITPPDSVPTKPADENFWYRFSHWSLTENGSAFDFETQTVTRDADFFAVFDAFDHSVWDGETQSAFTSGKGTASKPYKISTGSELAYLAAQVNGGNSELAGAYYELSADIRLSGAEWTPIGTSENPFSGVFNGRGYIVTDFKITGSTEYAGLFGYIKNAVIKKLSITEAQIALSSEAGVYAGVLAGYAKAQNAVCEISEISIDDCTFDVSSKQSVYAGNLAGFAVSEGGAFKLSNCYTVSDISVCAELSCFAGGLVGAVEADNTDSGISNSYSLSFITAVGESVYAGGIVGQASGAQLIGCFTTGDITARSVKAALAGYTVGALNNGSAAEDCYYLSEAEITAEADGVPVEINTVGTITSSSSFRSSVFLSEKLGFDFDGVWEYGQAYAFPILKAASALKDNFKVTYVNRTGANVTATVNVTCTGSPKYTVSMTVYDSRGRMVGTASSVIDNTVPQANELMLGVSGIADAAYIKIIVTDRATLSPLFSTVTKVINGISTLSAGNVIISNSTPGIDENGFYRNYYDYFNPFTGTKNTDAYGLAYASSTAELTSPVASGTVVRLDGNGVDEASKSYGSIDVSTNKGLVWIYSYDEKSMTAEIVPVENMNCWHTAENYVYGGDELTVDGSTFLPDSDGHLRCKVTGDTVITLIKGNSSNGFFMWGTIKILDGGALSSSSNVYKCFNDRIADESGTYKTAYAKYQKAYISFTRSADGLPSADYIVIIVNGGEPEKFLTSHTATEHK